MAAFCRLLTKCAARAAERAAAHCGRTRGSGEAGARGRRATLASRVSRAKAHWRRRAKSEEPTSGASTMKEERRETKRKGDKQRTRSRLRRLRRLRRGEMPPGGMPAFATTSRGGSPPRDRSIAMSRGGRDAYAACVPPHASGTRRTGRCGEPCGACPLRDRPRPAIARVQRGDHVHCVSRVRRRSDARARDAPLRPSRSADRSCSAGPSRRVPRSGAGSRSARRRRRSGRTSCGCRADPSSR